MDYREHLRRLLADMNLTEWELADRLGLHRGAIVRLLTNQRRPEPMECLLLAGISNSAPEREYWLDMSGLTAMQRQILSRGLGSPELDLTHFPPEIGADIALFLEFVANAHPERRKAVRSILRGWQEGL